MRPKLPAGVALCAAILMGVWASAWAADEAIIYPTSASAALEKKAPMQLAMAGTPSATSVTLTPGAAKSVAALAGKPVAVQPVDAPAKPSSPWKRKIVTTYFWIGQGCTTYSPTTNYSSAWDKRWKSNFGGTDDPNRRVGFTPSKFAATLNPFYVALPFNDVKYPKLARKYVPWWDEQAHRDEPYQSQCKGHWVEIRVNGKSCFGQWEDVGPLRYDHAAYVFGNERPQLYSKAGLDVSPAIHDYLGLDGLDLTDWRFVEAQDVPAGPWLKYGEQAIVFSALKRLERPGQPSFFPLP